jgi:transposase
VPTPSDQPARSTVALEQENAALRRQVSHLERVCDEQQATMGQLQSRLEAMAEQVTLLKKALFGCRRERFLPSPDQKLLFTPESLGRDDDEQEPSSESDEDAEESEHSTGHRRRQRRKRFEFPQCLPVKRIEHPLPPEELACPCGCGDRVVIREHVTKQLELEPSNAYVAEHVRYTYACPHCRGGDRMVTTQKPETANEKGIFGPTALAYLADAKFVRHLPLYRLQEQLRHASKMWFGRGVLSGSLCRTAMRLRPLRDLIHAEILLSFYLHADETTARLLCPGRGKALLAYLWAYSGDREHPYVLFDFHQSRSRAGPRDILGDYRGGLLTDGHSAYVSLVKESEGRLLDLGCWAHGRRGFDEACAVSSHGAAHEALAWIGQLYDIEDRLAEQTPDERLRVRREESVPILQCLSQRLREVTPTLRPSSRLAEAIGYVLNRWPAMVRYAEDGRYAIDNNLLERLLRPAVIGRKNYLFYGSDVGGDAAAIWYTIIQSARRNLVDILPYLTDVLTRLPTIVPEYLSAEPAVTSFSSLADDQVAALRSLLPDVWLREHPEHLLAERAEELAAATARRRRRRAKRRIAVKS